MMLLLECLRLFLSFFRIGLIGFGGGYAMLSMIMMESAKFGITTAQFADLNALDMIVPGPLAINAATYVGFLSSGFWGSVAATAGVSLPPFFIVPIAMHFLTKFKENTILKGALSGIKPAAVGLISAASFMIARDVILKPGADVSMVWNDIIGAVSFLMVGVFLVTAVANIRFKVNPILLTLLAGVVGAVIELL